jgi:hypothetical protein
LLLPGKLGGKLESPLPSETVLLESIGRTGTKVGREEEERGPFRNGKIFGLGGVTGWYVGNDEPFDFNC